jgi:hypothetical protein
MLLDRAVVRIVVMRGTIHLVSADDALVLRPLAQPVLDRELASHSEHRTKLVGVDLAPVLDVARALVAERPRTGAELRAAFAERFPDHDAAALTYACRNHLAFVQVPPRGLWGKGGQVTYTTAETWLGRPVAERPSIDTVVRRYFAAFGPASAADVAAWCRLTGMREVIDRLHPKLRPFRDERGRELFDLPDAPRPDPDTAAPVRFLPEYDNVLLSHDDRSRFAPVGRSDRFLSVERKISGTVLHDGLVVGTWRMDGDAVLVIDHAGRLTKRATSAIAAEGRRMVRFLHGTEADDVRFNDLVS